MLRELAEALEGLTTERGLLLPEEFLAPAERTGLIVPIGILLCAVLMISARPMDARSPSP